MRGKIHLKNIQVTTLIGCKSYERGQKQPLIVDLIMEVPLEKMFNKDHVDSTVDYSQIPPFIEAFAEKSSYHLLERFTVELAHQLADFFKLLSIRITVQKPLALKNLAAVSFEYFLKT